MMKLTRRNLATVLASAAVATAQQLDSPVGQPATAALPADEPMKTARDRMQSSAAALNKPAIPMATEPAFQFKV